MKEFCTLYGCELTRGRHYAEPSVAGRSHASKHHYIPERFFGRSKNRPGDKRDPIFIECPWDVEGEFATFCYECHEELLHNPVLLPNDLKKFEVLINMRGLNETEKTEGKEKLAGRIKFFHEIIEAGLDSLLEEISNA